MAIRSMAERIFALSVRIASLSSGFTRDSRASRSSTTVACFMMRRNASVVTQKPGGTRIPSIREGCGMPIAEGRPGCLTVKRRVIDTVPPRRRVPGSTRTHYYEEPTTASVSVRLDSCLEALPLAYPGPGGACAVVRKGEVLARHTWGWANAERRIAFTPGTLFRMCSITKQFTCALLLDLFPDPSMLDGDVRERLPLLREAPPSALHLCHNQSGLRDYWAVAMLHGAPVEAPFGEIEAARVIGRARTLQFRPGTRYSYANQNFRMLSEILQARTDRSFAELLRSRVFERAGMASALLLADTRAMPDGAEGYEGTSATGFRAAENRIFCTGDAGVGACLDDMIAWERHIDATRDDAATLYSRLSAPVTFADGAPAVYGFGLYRTIELGRAVTNHGGALRGWSSHRLYMPSERVSVVVMFNHLSDAHEAAVDLLAAVLGEDQRTPAVKAPSPGWLGAYVEPETGLAVRIEGEGGGRVRLRYGNRPERLDPQPDGTARSPTARLWLDDGALWMDRLQENQSSRLSPRAGASTKDVAGRYRCEELDAELTVTDAGRVLYGGFSGFLGQGRMEMLEPIGRDLWALPCWRALDHSPPGDWTLSFQRGDEGRVTGIEVGCWLPGACRTFASRENSCSRSRSCDCPPHW
jgi:D-aminopeptidase